MIKGNPEGDVAAERLERRWFAAFKAASSARAECEDLLEAMQRSEEAWNRARARLSELEALRDSLGEELAELDAARPDEVREVRRRPVLTAA
jgi:chromosome segregation ATPase